MIPPGLICYSRWLGLPRVKLSLLPSIKKSHCCRFGCHCLSRYYHCLNATVFLSLSLLSLLLTQTCAIKPVIMLLLVINQIAGTTKNWIILNNNLKTLQV